MTYILRTINNSEANVNVKDILTIKNNNNSSELTLKNNTRLIVKENWRFYRDSLNQLNLIKVDEPEKPSYYIKDEDLCKKFLFGGLFKVFCETCKLKNSERLKDSRRCRMCKYKE